MSSWLQRRICRKSHLLRASLHPRLYRHSHISLRLRCNPSYVKPIPFIKPLHSGLGTVSAASGLFIFGASLFAWWSLYDPETVASSLESDQHSPLPVIGAPSIWVAPGMPAEILPGRPGNLTPEQVAKLKELWEALFEIAGLSPGRTSVESAGTGAGSNADDPSSAPAKGKKRLGGLLGRRKVKDDDELRGSADTEDKHGQNKEFRQALAEMSPAELRKCVWDFTKADDPDALLLRFLRARKWNVHDALVMLVSTIHWRGREVHLDDKIMASGEAGALEAARSGTGEQRRDGEGLMQQLRLGKSYLHGTDKEGRPICYVRVRLHKQGEQSEASLENFTVYTIETARFLLRPPVDTACVVFDMTSFSMANMDYTPVKYMIKVFEANYPESLGAVLVYKSPWIFEGIWRIIRGWLDPVVASKVHFTRDIKELEEYISLDHIPTELGGRENWEYHYLEPRQGENDIMRDGDAKGKVEVQRWQLVEEYERATMDWCRAGNGAQDEKRTAIAQKLAENYWKLDPYVRARSVYDRSGVINQGGRIDMYPKMQDTHHTDVD